MIQWTLNLTRQIHFWPTTSSFLSDIPLLVCFSPQQNSQTLGFCFRFEFHCFYTLCFSSTRAPSTWNEETLRDLGMLPLYLTSTFYGNFDKVSNSRSSAALPHLSAVVLRWVTRVLFNYLCLLYSCEQKTKRSFLRYFLRTNKVDRQRRKAMRREIRKSDKKKSKRSLGESPSVVCSALTSSWIYNF